MKVRREILPIVLGLIFIIVAREIYPYAGVMEAKFWEGYEQETIATGLGGPTCLVFEGDDLLICDRDGGRILTLEGEVLLSGLNAPHGLAILDDGYVISEKGKLTKYDSNFQDPEILVSGIPVGNHQQNAVNV
ncbi:MAG: hypothetical protein VW862_06535, partial [Euryarchaeota archaeon]